MTSRRLSQAIAEGAGISLLFELDDPAAVPAEGLEAGGVVLRGTSLHSGISVLPVLAYCPTPDEAAALGADAVVVEASTDEEELVAFADRAAELGLELVVRADDEDDVSRVLDSIDPEIFLLAGRVDDDTEVGQLEKLLSLLPDVPAGKLAIAELSDATRADIEELERAGVDAVVVSGDLDELSGDAVPDV